MIVPENAHTAAALIKVLPDFAFERLSSAAFVGRWSLGSMSMQPVAPSVYVGQSLFDGSSAHVEIRPAPQFGLIDFAVGNAEQRYARIFIRVTPGPVLGYPDDQCLVTLNAFRSAAATDASWTRTCVTHETEILLIKAQLEAEQARGQA